MLEVVVNEYLSIVDALLEDRGVENNRIIVEREYFKNPLGKYNYMKFQDKTRIYKMLNFIIHDNNNYPM